MDAGGSNHGQSSARRRARFLGRAALLVLLLFSAALLYLKWVGVPQFVHKRIAAQLRTRGLAVEIGNIHLQGWRTLVVEDVRLAPVTAGEGPVLLAPRTELRLRLVPLLALSIRPDRIRTEEGQILWPGPDETPPLRFDQLTGALRIRSGNRWILERFQGNLRGLDIQISGTLTNAAVLAGKLRTDREPDPEQRARFNRLLSQLGQSEFSPDSQLQLQLSGDGAQLEEFRGEGLLRSSHARTPWGQASGVELSIEAGPDSPHERSVLHVRLQATEADHPWGTLENLTGTGTAFLDLEAGALEGAEWAVQLGLIRTTRFTLEDLESTGSVRPGPETGGLVLDSNARAAAARMAGAQAGDLRVQIHLPDLHFNKAPEEGNWSASAASVETERGQAGSFHASGNARRFETGATMVDEHWGNWSALAGIELDWEAELKDFDAPELQVEHLRVAGQWRPPTVELKQISTTLYGGTGEGHGTVDVGTGELQGQARFDFDVRELRPLLTEQGRQWISQFTWEKPPEVSADARLVIPRWTNLAEISWTREILPQLRLKGGFTGGAGTFRNVPVSGASSTFQLHELLWHLPDLHVLRPEGNADLDLKWDMVDQDFHFAFRSQVAPEALRPLIPEESHRIMDFFQFSFPPRVDGEISGRWMEWETLEFNAQLAVPEFAFRGESFDQLNATVHFQDGLITCRDASLRRGVQQITAPIAVYDLAEGVVYTTNAVSTMDPDLVTRIIGPVIRRAIEPYQFREPPVVRVNGRIPTLDREKADVHFEVAGKSFHYWKLNAPHIAGDLHWLGETLTISNVHASFYGGELFWEGFFDFDVPGPGADFRFRSRAVDSDLNLLRADLFPRTDRLEGTLNGHLVVSHGRTTDMNSWTGYGEADLRDGFLWGIPVFGFLSRPLDRIVPGFGQSPVTGASATFELRDGLLHTDDLEVRSPLLRLRYEGSVSLEGEIDARVQAEILRDAWAVGRVISFLLRPVSKVFEYRISGTILELESEPMHIPRGLRWPLRPFRTLRELFTHPEQVNGQ